MINLQKKNNITVLVWYKNNGHFKGKYKFDNGLKARNFIKKMLNETKVPLVYRVSDGYVDIDLKIK